MNLACASCGKIITVPDIPLPEDYTQRCTFCGYNNPVSDEAPAPQASVDDLDDWDTLDSTASGSVGNLSISHTPTNDSDSNRAIHREFEDKLREMETRLRAELKNVTAVEKEGPSPFELEARNNISTQTAIVSSNQPGLFQNCEPLLSKLGFKAVESKTIDHTYKSIVNSPYQVIILDQQFIKSSDAGRNVLKYIKRTPLQVRRCQVVILITPGVPTGEPQAFFQWGLDFNINPKDLRQLDTFVENIMHFKDELLSPYLAK